MKSVAETLIPDPLFGSEIFFKNNLIIHAILGQLRLANNLECLKIITDSCTMEYSPAFEVFLENVYENSISSFLKAAAILHPDCSVIGRVFTLDINSVFIFLTRAHSKSFLYIKKQNEFISQETSVTLNVSILSRVKSAKL